MSDKQQKYTNTEVRTGTKALKVPADSADSISFDLNYVLDCVAIAIRIIRTDFSIGYVNRAFAELSGITPQEAAGKQCWEVFPSPACHTRECRLQRILAGENIIRVELNRTKPDAVQVPCSITALPLRDSSGELIGIVESFRDITEPAQLRNRVKEAEDRYKALADLGGQIGAAVMVLQDVDDVEGKHIFVNNQWERLSGYTREELLNMSNFDIFSPKDRARILEGHRGSRAEGQQNLGSSSKHISSLMEMTIIRKDGKEIPVETEGVWTTYQGNPAVIVYMRDISERKKVEESLRESENLYRTVFETTGAAMHLLDEQGNTMLVNEQFEKLYGWNRTEAIGKHFTELVAPSARARTERYFKMRSMNTESVPKKHFTKIVDNQGHTRHTLVAVSMIPGSKKRVLSQLDVTDIKILENSLKRSKNQLRSLARRVITAHEEERARVARELHDELTQELIALRMETTLLADSFEGTDKKIKFEQLIASMDRLFDMLQDISSNLRPKMLGQLGLFGAIQHFTHKFTQRSGIMCSVEMDEHQLQTDLLDRETATEVFRIVQEALTNIFRHARATRTRIKLSNKKGVFTLTIQDNGIGMNIAEIEEKVNTGILGMRERASIIGGNLRIGSSPGKGVKLTLSLPTNSSLGASDEKSVSI